VTFSYGDEQGEADYLVIAAGRGPDVEGLGLDEAGVKLDDTGSSRSTRTAHVGEGRLRDRRPRPGPALAHKASDEGVIAAEDAAGHGDARHRVRRHPARHLLLARTSRRSG
jgi:dihydrolipoamide dehydrogenase